jgi:hypothetical protein
MKGDISAPEIERLRAKIRTISDATGLYPHPDHIVTEYAYFDLDNADKFIYEVEYRHKIKKFVTKEYSDLQKMLFEIFAATAQSVSEISACEKNFSSLGNHLDFIQFSLKRKLSKYRTGEGDPVWKKFLPSVDEKTPEEYFHLPYRAKLTKEELEVEATRVNELLGPFKYWGVTPSIKLHKSGKYSVSLVGDRFAEDYVFPDAQEALVFYFFNKINADTPKDFADILNKANPAWGLIFEKMKK